MKNSNLATYRITLILVIILVVLGGCKLQKGSEEDSDIKGPHVKHTEVSLSGKRVVALGDIHGDVNALRRALVVAGAIDTKDNWIGNDLIIVQTGDLLDRGDDEIEIILLLEKLKKEAISSGGAIFTLTGNHETMNIKLNFRYVKKPEGFDSFEKKLGISRREAFKPGGRFAKILSNYPVVLNLDGNIFVHGGIDQKHVKYGLKRINQKAREWMLGKISHLPEIVKKAVWMRDYSKNPDKKNCQKLKETLNLLGAKRMIVGHSRQRKINAVCHGLVWRIDTGMSAHYGGRVQVLEIKNGAISIIQ